MKTNTQYKVSDNLAVVLVGEPKTGKTRVAMAFPSPYFLDLDKNLSSAVRVSGGKEFFFDTVDTDDTGKAVPAELQLDRAFDCLKAAAKDPRVKTIVIDSVTRLGELVEDHIIGKLRKLGVKLRTDTVDEQIRLADYATYGNLLLKFVAETRASGKYVVWTSHQTADKDELTGAMRYFFSISGKLKNTLGGYFTDVWGLTAQPLGQGKTKYSIRTKPTGFHVALGTSLPLAPELDITDKSPDQIWSLMEPIIKGTKAL